VRLARALLCLIAVAASLPARADNPVIHVRARLRIDLDAVERVPGGVLVHGSLRDDASDEPVAGRVVAVSLEGPSFWHYAEPTGPDGSFRWRVPLPLGTYRLHIGAGGGEDYVAPTAIDRTLDVGLRTPTVTLQLPARVAAHAAAMHVVVEAHETDGMGPPRAYEGRVRLRVGGEPRGDVPVEDGHADFDLPGPFGRAGNRIEVTAEIPEDEERNGALVSKSVLLTTTSQLALGATPARLSPVESLAVTGALRDDDGPIAGAEVVLGIENGADLATFTTDEHGVFDGEIRGRDLPGGAAFIEARYRPREEWRDGSVSPTVPIDVLPAPPAAVWPYVISPLVTLLAALVAFFARDRRWRRWFAVARRVRRRGTVPASTTPGLAESRRGILSSLRRPDHGLSGVVVDAADDRPIPTATLVARPADSVPRAATVDEHGRFAFEELPAGELIVSVAAPGYVSEHFTRALPHRGELRGARVRLVPVRARIFDAWRRAAAPLSPAGRAVETMTPRELLAHVERKRLVPHERLAALTALVESAVWGARAPSAEDLTAAEEIASELKADS